jgi:chloride channel 3/4/5
MTNTAYQDLLTEMNSYPFLNNKHKPIFTSDLADIVPRVRKERIIDITNSPVVPALSLRTKLELLHKAGELDGGLPIVRDGILVGLIPAPDLEYALDNLRDEVSSLCLMAPVPSIDDSDDGGVDPTDFTPFIDPVSRLVHSCKGKRKRVVLLTGWVCNDRLRWRWILGRRWIWCMSVL